jgi:peroxiredoxin
MDARLLLIGLMVWLQSGALQAADVLGEEAPDFVLKSLSGENLRLSEFRGEVVLLNFWASWCGPCRDEMPRLESLRERYERVGLRLLSVSLDDDSRGLRETVEGFDVRFPILVDAGREVARRFGIDDMPATLLIDREGVVRHVSEGRRGRDEDYTEALRALLDN